MSHGLLLLKGESGIALITALLILMSLTTIGLFATNATIVHQDISANLKASKQGFYLAEAGIQHAALASITAPATCGHSASPDNVLVGIS